MLVLHLLLLSSRMVLLELKLLVLVSLMLSLLHVPLVLKLLLLLWLRSLLLMIVSSFVFGVTTAVVENVIAGAGAARVGDDCGIGHTMFAAGYGEGAVFNIVVTVLTQPHERSSKTQSRILIERNATNYA